MSRRSRARFDSVNIWPAFVDVLSTLLIITIFTLLVFMLAQFFLSRTLSSRDETIERLEESAARLAESLAMETAAKAELQFSVSSLSARLRDATARADDAETRLNAVVAETEEARLKVPTLSLQLEQLNAHLATLRLLIDESNRRAREKDVQIENLGMELNAALAEKVQELRAYRSEFFERVTKALGERDDIRIVGDRFVFQSEVFFASASAILEPQGEEALGHIAQTLVELSTTIPDDVNWILRVDGHTDRRPINTPQFRSNWELSAARAISVVNFLIEQGVPPERLVAAGFGSHQPIDPGASEAALNRNRRIELKLDQR